MFKSASGHETVLNRERSRLVHSIWSKNKKYKIQEILNEFDLSKSTYYDELNRINNNIDKYAKVKHFIKEIFIKSNMTYGHRRMKLILEKFGFNYCLETIRKIMKGLHMQPMIYNKRNVNRYNSFKGNIGKLFDNLLNQEFNEKLPYKIFHTDITQIKMSNQKNGYISAVIDQASKEVIALQVSSHPDKSLILNTLKEVKDNIPNGIRPIMHSDQGWHYQLPYYISRLHELNFTQSMSRRGNCLDNSPIESFFSLLKRECTKRYKINNINELTTLTSNYVFNFNNYRISTKTKGMSPIEYREHSMF